jgi:hypothetical protein
VIRGRVVSDSLSGIGGADIYVTMAPDRTVFHALTDSTGRYELRIPNGSGDYLVHISALGRAPNRRRVTRVGTDSVYVVDAKLAFAAQRIGAVRVQATKPRPIRGADYATGVGGAERIVDGLAGAVPPGLAGDFSAASLSVPGTLSTGGGYSVMGLAPTQNSVTVGGLAFPGGDIPRDARTTTRVSASTYDPSRGWFSGANVNADLIMGNLFRNERSHITVDSPPLQANSAVARSLGSRFTRFQASYGADGPVTYLDKDFFNYSVQVSRQVSDARSVVDADRDALDQLGLSPDSAQRALSILRGQGVPITGSFDGSTRVTQNASFIGRFDHAPVDLKNFTPAKTSFGITTYAKLSHSDALGVTPTATLGHSGESSLGIASVQGLFSRFFKTDYLNETRSSLSLTRSRSTPYLDVPEGRVLVTSALTGGTASNSALAFGGNAAIAGDSRLVTWETINETKFYAPGPQVHRIKLTADARFDAFAQTIGSNTAGAFAYNSIADLVGNSPVSFTRTLNDARPSGGEWNAFIALGDLWRVTPNFQVTYGGRLEGNRFTAASKLNPAVTTALGVASTGAPNSGHFSPRAGFTWYIRTPVSGVRNNNLGSFTIGPTAFLRGGVGEFRSLLSPTLLASSAAYTGLPNGIRQLTCLGSAVPSPDWDAYAASSASIPVSCVAPNAAFVDSAPRVELVSKGFRPPRSWRGNLAYGSTYKRLTYSIEGIYSINLDQPELVDRNFDNAARFATAIEGRPVFVPTGSIVGASGLLSPVLARNSAAFGSVIERRSDSRSSGRQVTVTATPNLPASWYLSTAYTLGSIRMTQRGFGSPTFGSPVDETSGRGDLDVRHQVLVSFGYTHNGITLSGQTHVMSGLPFTPMVGTDVNGDGFSNDRAFVFNPAATPDTALAGGISHLISSAPAGARQCLRAQLGQPAALNSCEGPWTATLNAQLSVTTAALRAHRVSSIALNINNALGGLDQLVNGSAGLRGWGATAVPDRTLLQVRGFDDAALAYRYVVNPSFGSTAASRAISLSPFRLTLDVSMNLGRPPAEQQMDQWIKPGRANNPGPRLTAEDLRKRYERNVPDPYAVIIQESDSLLLSRDQVEKLIGARTAYRARIDSVWIAMSQHMAALGDAYDGAAVLKYQESSVDAGWDLTRADVQEHFPEILSPIQLRLLPGWAGAYFKATAPMTGYRYFSFGTPP